MSTKQKSTLFLLLILILVFPLNSCDLTTNVSTTAGSQDAPQTATSQPNGGVISSRGSEIERNLNPEISSSDLSSLSQGNSEFAFDLYRHLRNENDNLFFSPFSISLAVAMVFAGARNETEAQIAQTMEFRLPQEQLHPSFNALSLQLDPPGIDDPDANLFQLEIANSLWLQDGSEYQQDYLDLIATHYGSGLNMVNFETPVTREQARVTINEWVSNQTEDKINELIPKDVLTELTRLVITNAIYFNAKWEMPFLGGTTVEDFSLLTGVLVPIQLMARRAPARYTQGPDYQAVEIPYKGGSAAMIVILPEPGAFENVEDRWDLNLVEEINAGLTQGDVKLFLPKFSFRSNINLAQNLIDLGMPDAFDSKKADFTGIIVNPSPRLYLKHVLHQAFVSVDELGTEAAASTAIIAEIESMPLLVRVDRPFLFYIYDQESLSILFMGRVLDPSE